ncbi:VOC family protein [Larkinella soli]|uniref:VOC family protein n=1 Tax=Larkinella soli TaxID=1770527 RepID=UPI000FFC656C|nr:VOC family protein [Larkinella soli]
MNLNCYLTFNGDCEQAMNFYSQALNGTIQYMQRFGESPMEIPETAKNRVMHAVLSFGDNVLMASDSMPDFPVQPGTHCSLSLNLTSGDEIERVFGAISEGGNVTMPLEDTFWGARFGMCTDRFGVNWMFNYDLPKN